MSNDQPEPSKTEWPMITITGTKVFKYYSNWQSKVFHYSPLRMDGTVSGLDLDDPCGGAATIQGPKRYRSIVASGRGVPNLREEAADQGNEESIQSASRSGTSYIASRTEWTCFEQEKQT